MLKSWFAETWPLLWPVLASSSAFFASMIIAGYGVYLMWRQFVPLERGVAQDHPAKDIALWVYVIYEMIILVGSIYVCFREHDDLVVIFLGIVEITLLILLSFFLPSSFNWWLQKSSEYDDE